MSGLPLGWAWSSLEETCASAGGSTPSKAEPDYWDNGTIPWVSPKDMKSRVIMSSEDRVTERALGRLTMIPAGSVLMVVRSGILSRTLPVAVTALPVTVNQDMRAFIPRPGVSSDYLAWQLIGKEREVLAATSKDGTTVASIEAPALASFPLAIAPAAEQTRIVAKLEELMSDLDAGVAELKAAQQKLQQYRQSLLKAAVEGRLTAAWRDARRDDPPTETGADLLAHILRERRARWEAQQLAKFEAQGKTPPKGWQQKYVDPVNPRTTGLPALPPNWVWASVEQLAILLSGSTPKDAGDHATPTGTIHWFKVGDMNRLGNEERLVAAQCAFASKAAESLGLKVAPAGTIVFPKRGGAIATNKKRRLGVAASYDLNLMGLVPSNVIADWLWLWFSGIDLGRLSDGSNVPQINNPDIAPLPVPLPTSIEQVEIIRILTEQSESLGSLVATTELLLKQSTAQRQNLLRAAFAGQLVPQDPADEPAAELLARIRAERAQQQAPAHRRKPRRPA